MKNNKNGFSIMFAMWMALISTLIVIYMLEYMIPFSKNVKGIENSTAAYYNAMSAVENSLYFITQNTIWSESGTILPSTATGSSFQIYASGVTLPSPWYGNSEFDTNRSRLSIWEPVQISLPAGIAWWSTKIFFRVPNFDYIPWTIDTIDASINGQDLINWQLSSTWTTLNSQVWSRFTNSNVCSSTNNGSSTFCVTTWNVVSTKLWTKLDNTTQNIQNFYTANCLADYECTFKLSIINSLKWQTNGIAWKAIPYLEYKIIFPINVPSNIVRINIKGKSYGFQKEFDIFSPRESLIEAFDFTVFQ